MKRLVALACLVISGMMASIAAAAVTAGITLSATGPAAALALYEKAHGPDSRTTFGAHSWDAMLLRSALPEALKAASPGTPQFRRALRDALEKSKDVAATQGVFTYSPTDHVGLDQRARVLTRIEKSNWKLLGAG